MASTRTSIAWANTLRPLQAVSWLISNLKVIQSFSRLYRQSHGLFNNLNPYPKKKVLLEAVKILLEALRVLIEDIRFFFEVVSVLTLSPLTIVQRYRQFF
jgi:hypothetical protein